MLQIYLIPKDLDWQYNLNNVRPIALLETLQKCTTKIFTKRLAQICCRENILKGPNFESLSGGLTEEPVHIINALIEDAKDNKKELWLVFQDMKKAFDSVSLVALDLALKRLKIPKTAITFILNLFEKRQSKIITDLGTTEAFEIKDGIEQGEVISPLVWRIFYDPLLERIQKDPDLGYTLHVLPNNSAEYLVQKKKKWRQAVVAFADDTTWVASSKAQMERTIEIAEDFFSLNDIQINRKKTKLITMNTKSDKKERTIFFGKEWIQEESENKIIQFLGIWLNCKLKESTIRSRAKEVIRTFIQGLNLKKLTVSQILYINNMCIISKLCYILQTTRL